MCNCVVCTTKIKLESRGYPYEFINQVLELGLDYKASLFDKLKLKMIDVDTFDKQHSNYYSDSNIYNLYCKYLEKLYSK